MHGDTVLILRDYVPLFDRVAQMRSAGDAESLHLAVDLIRVHTIAVRFDREIFALAAYGPRIALATVCQMATQMPAD